MRRADIRTLKAQIGALKQSIVPPDRDIVLIVPYEEGENKLCPKMRRKAFLRAYSESDKHHYQHLENYVNFTLPDNVETITLCARAAVAPQWVKITRGEGPEDPAPSYRGL